MGNHGGFADVDHGVRCDAAMRGSSLPGEENEDGSRHAHHRRFPMVTALATTTAVCGAVLLAFVGYLLWRRTGLSRRAAVFRCNFRRLNNCELLPAPPWARQRLYAEWVH